ncbi:MAG: plasmid recombination protein [Oscillospiraceae bacterium]|nr:plasmid recombination protein [Oscillospiraceae bacterium]
MAAGITSNHNKNLGNGQTGNLIHNDRKINPKNVDPRLIQNNIIFKNSTLAAAYEEAFGDAIDEYNHKQKRSDRRKYDRKGYFKHLFGVEPENESAQVILTSTARGRHEIKSFNEDLFQVGDCQEFGHFMRDEYGNFIDKDGNPVKWDTKDRTYYDVNGNEVTDSSNLMPNPEAERAKAILTCFYEGGRFKFAADKDGRPCLERLDDNSPESDDLYIPPFEERNPSFKVVYATIHNDEWHGTPHIHIDYVPVGSGYTKGPEKQVGFERALADMGFTNKNVAYKQWRNNERLILKTICNCFGYETKTREEEKANNRNKTYTTKEYSDIIRDAKADAQEIRKDAEQQAQEIIEGAEVVLKTTKEEACKIKKQAENDAAVVIHKAFVEKEQIENEAETIRNQTREEAESIITAAKQEAADIVDEALRDKHNLKSENKALTEENENLKNDIQSNRKQIMILVGIIANMPKKKFKLFRDTEKYEMDKEAYDGFMSAVDTMKRLSGNTLTSDEDKAAIEERLRQIEQHKADIERNFREQAEQL